MTDTLEKPAVDEFLELFADESEDKQCDHLGHDTQTQWHEGPAKYWQEVAQCPKCGESARGYRCAKFVEAVIEARGMQCYCGRIVTRFKFAPLEG